jgi:hypothetical protein
MRGICHCKERKKPIKKRDWHVIKHNVISKMRCGVCDKIWYSNAPYTSILFKKTN